MNEQEFNEQINNSIEEFNSSESKFEEYVDKVDEMRKRWQNHSTFRHYNFSYVELTEDEREFITSATSTKFSLTGDEVDVLKDLLLRIFDERIVVQPGCSSCVSTVKAKLIKLKTYLLIYDGDKA